MNLVSIIIPIYNQERYLPISIPSVLSQTYSNIEIVCVNDGSSDSSEAILQKYQNADSRIVIINQTNGGLAHAIATGVKHSTGEYICFVDSDDYLGIDFIENAMNEIGDTDFVAFGHYIDDGKKIYENNISLNCHLNQRQLEVIRNNIVWDKGSKTLAKSVLNSRWNKLYKKSLIDEIIDDYDSKKRISFGEDTIFTYLMLTKAKSGEARSKVNSYYYNTSNQNSMMSNEKMNSHIDKAAQSLVAFESIISRNSDDTAQAYVMYYFLIESLFQRVEYGECAKDFCDLYKTLQKDPKYMRALDFLIDYSKGERRGIFRLRRYLPYPSLYLFLLKLGNKWRKK